MMPTNLDPKDTIINDSEDNASNNEEKNDSIDNFSAENSFDCEYDNWSPD